MSSLPPLLARSSLASLVALALGSIAAAWTMPFALRRTPIERDPTPPVAPTEATTVLPGSVEHVPAPTLDDDVETGEARGEKHARTTLDSPRVHRPKRTASVRAPVPAPTAEEPKREATPSVGAPEAVPVGSIDAEGWRPAPNPFLTYDAMRRVERAPARPKLDFTAAPKKEPERPGQALAAQVSSITAVVTRGLAVDLTRPNNTPDDHSMTTVTAAADLWPFRLKVQGRFK